MILATQAAIAVENARLYDETERKGRELQRLQVVEERERIGKELHDGVIQSLFAVGMSLQGLASSSSDADTARRLEAAVEDVDHAIRDLRNYIFGLRPGILADRQLDQALKEMASEFGSRSGVVTVVEVDGQAASALASSAADVVQLAREALSNVSRHGAATTHHDPLQRGEAGLSLDDDGRGFDVDVTSRGMGLNNLRERVESLGGVLEVQSTPGEGTTVRATSRPERVPRDHGPSALRRDQSPRILVPCSPGISSSCRSRGGRRASPGSRPARVASRLGRACPSPRGPAPRRGGSGKLSGQEDGGR